VGICPCLVVKGLCSTLSAQKLLFGEKKFIDIICGGKFHEILNEYIWL
jgi:hypothetical protein